MCYPDLEGFVGGEVTVGLEELFLDLFFFFAFTLFKDRLLLHLQTQQQFNDAFYTWRLKPGSLP